MAQFSERLRGKLSNGKWLPFFRRLPAHQNEVGLSFDDGPSENTTPVILDLLRTAGARASFFLTGERAAVHPALLGAIIAEGHDVFVHGWHHLRYATMPTAELVRDLDRAEAILSAQRPTPSPYLVRLPYGSGHATVAVHKALRSWNPTAQIAHWDDPVEDWTLADDCQTVDQVRTKCVAAALRNSTRANLRGSILLMHDDPYDVTAPFVSQVMPAYLAEILKILHIKGFRGTKVSPISDQPLLCKYIRP